MYDWTSGERYTIENVDTEIHIQGIQAHVLPAIIPAFVISMRLHPLFFWVGPLIIIVIARKFWNAKEMGRPIDYEPWFQRLFGPIALMRELFSTMPALRHGREHYRS